MTDKILKLLIFVGIVTEIYLAFRLPIWHDEFYSVWASDHTLYQIINSYADPVHPPGYFLILHFLGAISRHVYWFRSLTLAGFILNVFLLKKLAEKIKFNSFLLMFSYVFSGYFLIFNWQIRMYTLIVTCILSSTLIYLNIKKSNFKIDVKTWLIFSIVNFCGLYLDFAFIWYFVPSAVFILSYLIYKKKFKTFFNIGLSYISSCLVFLLAAPQIIATSKGGINGINWMVPYTKLDFYGSYFLGSHTDKYMTYVFIFFVVAGLLAMWRSKQFNHVVKLVVFAAVSSLVFTLVYSHYVRQLFHFRSLQIVGLAIVFFYYGFLNFLSESFKKNLLLLLSMSLMVVNFFVVTNTLVTTQNMLILDFFPWKNVLNKADLNGISTVRYVEKPDIPTKMLIYGLEYTLEGNESIGRHRIGLEPYNNDRNCRLFYESLYMDLYACKDVF